MGRNVPRGQPRDKVGDMECERGKKRMSGAKVEEQIRGEINVIQESFINRITGSYVPIYHWFERGVKMSGKQKWGEKSKNLLMVTY